MATEVDSILRVSAYLFINLRHSLSGITCAAHHNKMQGTRREVQDAMRTQGFQYLALVCIVVVSIYTLLREYTYSTA